MPDSTHRKLKNIDFVLEKDEGQASKITSFLLQHFFFNLDLCKRSTIVSI